MHKWEGCSIDDVKFLKDSHRHVFHVELKASVDDPDRELEFFMIQQMIDSAIYNLYRDQDSMGYFMLGSRSCEMIAKEIIDFLVKHYAIPSNTIRCTVFEDNENGGTVKWCRDS
jgi:hypothetical protein